MYEELTTRNTIGDSNIPRLEPEVQQVLVDSVPDARRRIRINQTPVSPSEDFVKGTLALILCGVFAVGFFLFILPAIKLGELWDWTQRKQRRLY